jgi:aldose 1-epimerase
MTFRMAMCALVLLLTSPTARAADQPNVTKSVYGKMPDGAEVEHYTLTNSRETRVQLITFGAHVTSIEIADRDGKRANVTLGLNSLDEYLAHTTHFGCTVGRFANRIAKGRFALDGETYQLATNNGPNHLHGGIKSFDQVIWKAEAVKTKDSAGVRFRYLSPDGDENYPGNLDVTVVYSLNENNELIIDYKAKTDKPTIVNLTNHCYWNLAGDPSKTILGHELFLAADKYLLVNSEVIPTGEIAAVKGTPMDFSSSKKIGLRFPELLKQGLKGYGYCYVLRPPKEKLSKEKLSLAARVRDPESGRVMEIFTTQPGIQFYTGNSLDGAATNGGFQQYSAFCLETEHYPDSPNQPRFPSTVLRPGQTFHEVTVHRFSVAK